MQSNGGSYTTSRQHALGGYFGGRALCWRNRGRRDSSAFVPRPLQHLRIAFRCLGETGVQIVKRLQNTRLAHSLVVFESITNA